MRLVKATIDGFGKWTDTVFHFSDHMLYCFYGENESGKSTLQQFILYMFFGLPPKKRKTFIPKKRSGIGGTLTVHDKRIGLLTVERIDGSMTCYLGNGEERGETWWKEHLHSISKEVYTAVNAFSATDLEAIRTMDHAAISDILFSIGLSGSTAIYEIEKELADQLDTLYKRRGKNPKMNEQINKVVETSEALHRVRDREATYAPLMKEKEDEEARMEADKHQLQMLKKELIRIDKTIQSLPQVQTYQQNQEKLATFPVALTFPQDGLNRYRQLKEKMLPKISEYDLLTEKEQEYEADARLLQNNLLNETEFDLAKRLLEDKVDYEHRLKRVEQAEKAWTEAQEQCNQLINELGWDEDESIGTVLPFHLESTWQQLAADQHTMNAELSSLEEEQHLLEEKRSTLLHDEKEIRSQLLPDTERKQMEEKLASEQMERNNEQQKKDYDTWKTQQKDRMKKVIYLFIALSGIAASLGFAFDKPILYGLALLGIISAGIQYFYTGTQAKTIERMLLNDRTETFLSREERNNVVKKLEQDQALQLQLGSLNYELRQNNLLQIQAEEQQQILDKRTNQLDDRIESERFTYPFLQEVQVTHWSELLKMIRALQKKNKTVNDIKRDIEVEMTDIQQVNEQIETFPYADSFTELEALLEKQREMITTLKQYNRELEGIRTSKLEVEKHLETLQLEQNALFHTANVTDEEAFYKVAEDFNDKETLVAETIALKEQLYHLFSSSKAEELLASNLDGVTLESQREQLEADTKEMEEAISGAHHRLGELQAKIRQLEDSEDSSELSLTYEMEKNLLNEQATEWAVLKLVQTALQKAKQTYQEKHFTKVMQLTGDYFAQLTNGRYHKVYPPKGSGLFQVEGSGNIRYTVEELSQGTIDQLYVSLRFAIAKAMRDQFDLPLLIDDAFVHFDKTRTEQTVLLMEQLSEEQQVIFFTCKEEVAAQFKHVCPMQEASQMPS